MNLKAPTPEELKKLETRFNQTLENPTKDTLHALVAEARFYERGRMIDYLRESVITMKGGLMTPWAVRKEDVQKLIDTMRNFV